MKTLFLIDRVMLNLSYEDFNFSSRFIQYYAISVRLLSAANIVLFIIYILCEMWFKIILLHFYPQTQRRPAKQLMQFLCLSLLTNFFFCCNFTQITRQTASEPSKIIPKAISFICSPKTDYKSL